MQRRVLIGALLLAGGAPPAFAQAVEWQEIAGEEGRFRLQMPKGFREVSGPRPDGSMARQYQFTTSEGFGLDFAIVDFVKAEPGHPPTDLDMRLRDGQRAVQQRWPGSTVLGQRDVKLGSLQGRAFTLSIQGGSGVLIARMYYGGQRLYAQLAMARNDQRANPIIAHFMESLRIER